MNIGANPKPMRLYREPPVLGHEIEALIHRARQILGYMGPRDAMIYLAAQDGSPEDAFLAVKAAQILDGC